MFSFFYFSSFFPGGQLAPFAPICGHPWPQWRGLLLSEGKEREGLTCKGEGREERGDRKGEGNYPPKTR